MKIFAAIAGLWTMLGVMTYGQCMGQYRAKWPEWVIERNVWLVRRTCLIQGIIPITGLPIVLYRGTVGERDEYNNWKWPVFAWR